MSISAWQQRTASVLGTKGVQKLAKSTAVVVGLGGVGSFAFEALVRVGVGNMVIIDHDVVSETNLNRQLVAKIDTLGKPKVAIAKAHALNINKKIVVTAHQTFLTADNAQKLIPKGTDIIIDAIDSVDAKVALIAYAKANDIAIVSSMGTANKLDPTKFKFADIYSTSVDPLVKVMRKKLKDIGIKELKVVYSIEQPTINPDDPTSLGSVAYVPSVCGLICASKATDYLLNAEWS